MSIDVIGIGSLNCDYIYEVDAIAAGDSQVVIKTSSSMPGGSAANTVYWSCKLGIKTSFIGALGADIEGEKILMHMKDAGIDTSKIKVLETEHTSKVMVFVDGSGERAMYSHPGASLGLEISNNDRKFLRSSKFVIISAIPGLAQFDELKDVAENIYEQTKIVFMPGALYTGLGLKRLDEILPFVNILVLNRRELRMLTGLEHELGAEKLMNDGCQNVAVTTGKNGCYFVTNGEDYGTTVPSPRLKEDLVVDSTGAGDAFAAGLVFGLLIGKTNKQAAFYGSLAARSCIQSLGARMGTINKLKLQNEFNRFSKEILI